MLEITLLGEQRVSVDGRRLDALRSPRTLTLLGYLAVHRGAPQSRRHVAELFWPDSSDAQARTNLRRELHQLREALPDPDACLAVDSTTVHWRDDAPCSLDVAAFETAAGRADIADRNGDGRGFQAAAEHAVQAYGGELLPALYDDWVLAERDRLRWRCVALLDRLVVVCADAGEWPAAVHHARRRVELEPLEESGYRCLMSMQARAGDRAAALHTYHRCTTVLERELGVEPSAETVARYGELFVEATVPVPSAPELCPDAPLVGRVAELEALRAAWGRAAGGPRLVVVAGEAGIGKTRLAEELAGLARRGGAVVGRARCYGSKGRLALAPVADWLRSPALRPAVEQLDPVWRVEVARLIPELGGGAEHDRPEPLSDSWQRRRFLEGMARAVLAPARATLLVLDDLQWCDTDTLAWIELLLHVEPTAPLLVAATVRSEEREDNQDLERLCRQLRSDGVLDELELRPLAVDETAALAAGLLGRPLDNDAARRLQSETGGFPLFVLEAVRAGTLHSPRVDAVLDGRLAQLSPAADELAGLAAAVGRDFSLDLLATAGTLDEDALLAAIDELWRRRLLREHTAATYDFSHDLLRGAAYQRLSPPHRRLLHRRIASALEQLHADAVAPVAAHIADQHERAGQLRPAITFLALAAEAATDVFALDEAVGLYQRALALLGELAPGRRRDEQELRLRVAMTPSLHSLRGYTAPELRSLLERTIALGEQLGDVEVVLRSTVGLQTNAFVSGRIDEAAAIAARLMRHADNHPQLAGQFHHLYAGALTTLGHPADAIAEFDRAAERSAGDDRFVHGFRVGVMIPAWRAHALWLVGRAADAAETAEAASTLADDADHPYSQVLARAYGAITSYLLGDRQRVAKLSDSVRAMCDRYAFAYYGEWGRILAGWATSGAIGEALTRSGLDRLGSLRALARMPFYLAILAEVLAASGRDREASRALCDARALADAHGDRWWLAELWRRDAGFHTGAEADSMLHQAIAVAREQGSRALELRAATDLARRLVDAGQFDAASALLAPVRVAAGGCNPEDLHAADEVLDSLEANA
jgi:DNA-binding SARP family transcriptional activator